MTLQRPVVKPRKVGVNVTVRLAVILSFVFVNQRRLIMFTDFPWAGNRWRMT